MSGYPNYKDQLSEFYLTDGTYKSNGQLNKLDLLKGLDGICMQDWQPQNLQYKEGGYYSSSPISSGRRLVNVVYDTVIEVMTLVPSSVTQNSTIGIIQSLNLWLENAVQYWIANWATKPVYIVAKSSEEDNYRYAIVRNGSFQNVTNPYRSPFNNPRSSTTIVELTLEHGIWQDVPPGDSTPVAMSNLNRFFYIEWSEIDNTVTGTIQGLAQCNDGTVLAGSDDTAKIFESSDSGVTWSLLDTIGSAGTDAVNELAKDASGNIYAAVSGGSGVRGVYKSDDCGTTWTRVKNPTSYSADASTDTGYHDVIFDSVRNRIIAVGGGNDGSDDTGIVSVSTDEGSTWEDWELAPYKYWSSVVVDGDGRIYVGWNNDNGTVLRSKTTTFVIANDSWVPTDGDETGRPPSAWWIADDMSTILTDGDGQSDAPSGLWETNDDSNYYYSCNQTDTAKDPIFKTSQQNGHDAFRYSGSEFSETSLSLNGRSEVTLMAVFKDTSAGGGLMAVLGETGATLEHEILINRTSSEITFKVGDMSPQSLVGSYSWSQNDVLVIIAQMTSDGRKLWVNGELIASDVYTGTISSGAGLRFGGRYSEGDLAEGDLFEVIVYFYGSFESTIADLMQYAADRYALTYSIQNYEVIGSYLPFGIYDMVYLETDISERIWAYSESTSGGGNTVYRQAVPGNDFTTLSPYATVSAELFLKVYHDPDNPTDLYAGTDGDIYISENYGFNWQLHSTAPTGEVKAFLRLSDGTFLAGGDAQILSFGAPVPTDLQTSAVLGQRETLNPIYVANSYSQSNITHIKVYDASGASYTDVYPDSTLPYNMLPAVPAVGDIIYFGVNTSLTSVDTGPLPYSLVFDIGTGAVDVTGEWEYYRTAASWDPLAYVDGTDGLKQTGVNSVQWYFKTDWDTTTVDSVTGYWVRFRVTAIGSNPTAPTQRNRDIFSTMRAYTKIEKDQVGGEIPALARIRWYNISDNGDFGNPPYNYTDRIFVGLRSESRGINFQPYVNIADRQTPFGLTVTASTGAFADFIEIPVGRRYELTYSGGQLNAWTDLVSIEFDTSVASEYYGVFRAFLRCGRSGGDSDDYQFRIKLNFGTGGADVLSGEEFVLGTTQYEILDLGRIAIPTADVISVRDNIGDSLTITIQGYSTNSTDDVYLYDLILMPVDEWAADSIIPSEDISNLDMDIENDEYLDIDSVTNPKRNIASYLRTTSDLMESVYRTIANGPVILQVNQDQRFWFLAMALFNSGGVNRWAARPTIQGRVLVDKVQRYKSLRGSN